MPIISVIVATRNRRSALEQFLESARQLSFDSPWELVVVDNGSTDGTDKLLSAAGTSLPLVVIEEPQRGKSRALNRGLRQARGEILLFGDDDIVPDRDWLSALYRAAVRYPAANVFGGRILIDDQRIPDWVVESYNLKTILASEQDLGEAIRWFDINQYPVGPNLAVRRRTLENWPYQWPVNLGPGTKLPLGDERAFLMQFSPPEARDRLYVPASMVRHNIVGRNLRMITAVSRCFLGGYAAGFVDRHLAPRAAKFDEQLPIHAWKRYRECTSTNELVCSIARAGGVLMGKLSLLPRLVCE